MYAWPRKRADGPLLRGFRGRRRVPASTRQNSDNDGQYVVHPADAEYCPDSLYVTERQEHMICRSNLFVPGNRPDRFEKARQSGTDAVILDLEDAVQSAQKDLAHRAVAAWLARQRPVYVRIRCIWTKSKDMTNHSTWPRVSPIASWETSCELP